MNNDSISKKDAEFATSQLGAYFAIRIRDLPDDQVAKELYRRVGELKSFIEELFTAQSKLQGKYEYHYDHTDCIWYRPEARNRCPTTCAQYRDGWNDAMNYIFRDGKGYRPFRRDEKYE